MMLKLILIETCLIVTTLSGCGLVRHQEAECVISANYEDSLLPKPRVKIISGGAPRSQMRELDGFVNELCNELTKQSLVQVVGASFSEPGAVCTACSQESMEPAVLQMATNSLPDVELYSEEELPLQNWNSPENALTPGYEVLPEDYEIIVVIDEFIPYRPLRLRVSVHVVQASTGIEATIIQGAWDGTSHVGFPAAEQSKHKQYLWLSKYGSQVNDVQQVSPRFFLSNAAQELAHSIAVYCRNPTGAITFPD